MLILNHNVLSNNILELIRPYFKTTEDFKKIIPVVNELSKNISYRLISLYSVTINHLTSTSFAKTS